MLRIILAAFFAALLIVNMSSFAQADGIMHHSDLYRFEDFPVETEKVKKAPLQLEEGTFLSRFRTDIENAYKGQPNFGSRHILVKWGCGMECWGGAIADTKTGKVALLPDSRLGYDHRPGSNLLIVNPLWDEESEPGRFPSTPVTYYYLWDGERFALHGEEEWQYPEQSVTGSIVRESWKAVAYNQSGDAYVATGYATPHEAMLEAERSCTTLYGDCNTGVFVPMDWTIHVGTCSKARYVSLASSPDEQQFEADVRLRELDREEAASCQATFSH